MCALCMLVFCHTHMCSFNFMNHWYYFIFQKQTWNNLYLEILDARTYSVCIVHLLVHTSMFKLLADVHFAASHINFFVPSIFCSETVSIVSLCSSFWFWLLFKSLFDWFQKRKASTYYTKYKHIHPHAAHPRRIHTHDVYIWSKKKRRVCFKSFIQFHSSMNNTL